MAPARGSAHALRIYRHNGGWRARRRAGAHARTCALRSATAAAASATGGIARRSLGSAHQRWRSSMLRHCAKWLNRARWLA
jgi:hypothetical protein